MTKRVICFALGGHIATQNASFRRLALNLEPEGYEFFGAKDGFEAFKTGEYYALRGADIPESFAGFIAGAGRATLLNKEKKVDAKKMQQAADFFRKGKFDIAVGSGGDDHGIQMDILAQGLEGKVLTFVINKTMDNDLGGHDGREYAPFTDFTNGFHTAVTRGVNAIRHHIAGAWTNNLPYLVGHFGRETNWVGAALTRWSGADRIIYGELPQEHPGHSIERIYQAIVESQDKNEQLFGRRFAMIVVPEGSRISGIEHISADLIDTHGHHKLQPEVLVTHLKTELEKRYGLKTQTVGITYDMRNATPTGQDIVFARRSADIIAQAIEDGNNRVESTFNIRDGEICTDIASIQQVSQKRFMGYYPKPLLDEANFTVTDEIEKYYAPLFGKSSPLAESLPMRMKSLHV